MATESRVKKMVLRIPRQKIRIIKVKSIIVELQIRGRNNMQMLTVHD